MTVWHTARTMGWSTKAVIAVGLLAVLLVAAVPLALLVGLFMMLLGHIVGGLADEFVDPARRRQTPPPVSVSPSSGTPA